MQLFVQLLQKSGLFLLFLFLQILSLFLWTKTNKYQETFLGKKMVEINGYMSQKASHVNRFFYLRQANEKLQKANANLQKELIYYKNSQKKAQPFQRIDSIDNKTYQYTLVPVKIVNNSAHKSKNYLIINRGSKNGIRKRMGVVTDFGVVGIVQNVSDNYATVQSLLNTKTKITAQIKNDQNFGTLIWKGNNPKQVLLTELSRFIKVKKQDTIQTYGGKSNFPRYHPIGTVDSVYYNPTEGTNQIQVNLFEDFTRLQNAYVVKNKDIEEIVALQDSINEQENND